MIYINETKDKGQARKSYKGFIQVTRIFFFLDGLLLIIVAIVMTAKRLQGQGDANTETEIIFYCFGAVLLLLGVFAKKPLAKLFELAIKFDTKRTKQTRVEFHKNVFEVTISYPKEYAEYSYNELTVTEYPESWVLELGNGKWYTIEKSDMIEGSAEELTAFLSEQLDARYIISKNIL